mmetsp:Transcript_23938/g.36646  ORF Transcript_23938/g.36646 Transcript_23938/m.36646 type:complete len:257 (+) Transcript_23938:463-1233(+)
MSASDPKGLSPEPKIRVFQNVHPRLNQNSPYYSRPEQSDLLVMENPKVYLLILMFLVSSKDELYYLLTRINKRNGLYFLQKHFDFIDKYLPLEHIERFGVDFRQLTTISQHESGVNQIVKLSNKSLVTISDDCSMKVWRTASTGTIGDKVSDNDIKIEHQINTETTTCLCATGPKSEVLVTGCHSGNINIHKSGDIKDIKTISHAHQNLIRVLISLETLNNEYFLSADVCGTIMLWPSNIYQRLEKKRKDPTTMTY